LFVAAVDGLERMKRTRWKNENGDKNVNRDYIFRDLVCNAMLLRTSTTCICLDIEGPPRNPISSKSLDEVCMV